MPEREPTVERPRYSREQVIEAFKNLVAEGTTHPDELDLDRPEVIEANRIHSSWTEDIEQEAKRSKSLEAMLQFSLDTSTVLVDAGFTHPDYIEEVIYDWLDQDLASAEEEGLPVADRIRSKIDEIKALLP